jgi:predicted outer membrane repeat protein
MYGSSTLTTQHTSFKGNAAGLGGAIVAEHTQLKISACQFINNKASGSQSIVTFIKQHPAGTGGAVHVMQSKLHAVDSIFRNNQADLQGGGMQIVGGQFHGIGLLLDGNTAGQAGGGVSALDEAAEPSSSVMPSSGTTFTCRKCRFSGNQAQLGGGVYMAPAAAAIASSDALSLTLSNVTFSSNTAMHSGGGLSCRGIRHLSLVNSTFTLNTAAAGTGGGLACTLCQNVTITASVFTENSAQACGALLLLQSTGHSVIESSLFVQNAAMALGSAAAAAAAPGRGSAVDGRGIDTLLKSRLMLSDISSGRFGELVAYNASGSGGAMCVSVPAAATTLRHCRLQGNLARNGGESGFPFCIMIDAIAKML